MFDVRQTREVRAHTALSQSMDWRAETYALEKLNLGLSNHVFLATRGEERLVVRLFDAESHMLSVDRQTELVFSAHAARLGIGPKVVVINDEFSVSEFSSGRHPEGRGLLAHTFLEPYMEALRRLHSSSLQARQFNALDWIDRFIRRGTEYRAFVPERLPEALRLLAFVRQEMKKFPEVWSPCHNDQNGENVLHAGNDIILLDWEYAGLNNPLYELAKFAAHHALSTEQSEVLLAAYDGTLTDSRRRHFHLQRAVACMWMTGWLFLRSARPSREFDYQRLCVQRINQFLEILAGPEVALHNGSVDESERLQMPRVVT